VDGGREQEFSDFFVACFPGLRRTAYLVLGDWQLAEDLTQQGLAKMYVAWRRVRPDGRLAYARRVVVNECLSHLRRKRPETPYESIPDRVDGATAYQEAVLDLDAALALLPPRQRAIVALRFLDDLPVLEVASLLGIAEGTVKSQTARAIDTFRQHLPQVVPTLGKTGDPTPEENR
jgi:RNA polymerase sigma-70 factor (sigma-E family)